MKELGLFLSDEDDTTSEDSSDTETFQSKVGISIFGMEFSKFMSYRKL